MFQLLCGPGPPQPPCHCAQGQQINIPCKGPLNFDYRCMCLIGRAHQSSLRCLLLKYAGLHISGSRKLVLSDTCIPPRYLYPSNQHGKEGSKEGRSRSPSPQGDESDEGQEGISLSATESVAVLPLRGNNVSILDHLYLSTRLDFLVLGSAAL